MAKSLSDGGKRWKCTLYNIILMHVLKSPFDRAPKWVFVWLWKLKKVISTIKAFMPPLVNEKPKLRAKLLWRVIVIERITFQYRKWECISALLIFRHIQKIYFYLRWPNFDCRDIHDVDNDGYIMRTDVWPPTHQHLGWIERNLLLHCKAIHSCDTRNGRRSAINGWKKRSVSGGVSVLVNILASNWGHVSFIQKNMIVIVKFQIYCIWECCLEVWLSQINWIKLRKNHGTSHNSRGDDTNRMLLWTEI